MTESQSSLTKNLNICSDEAIGLFVVIRRNGQDARSKLPWTSGKTKMVIGRHDDCDIRVQMPTVSRHQAILNFYPDLNKHKNSGAVTIMDQGNVNRTKLNNVELEKGKEHLLPHKGVITVGDRSLRFEYACGFTPDWNEHYKIKKEPNTSSLTRIANLETNKCMNQNEDATMDLSKLMNRIGGIKSEKNENKPTLTPILPPTSKYTSWRERRRKRVGLTGLTSMKTFDDPDISKDLNFDEASNNNELQVIKIEAVEPISAASPTENNHVGLDTVDENRIMETKHDASRSSNSSECPHISQTMKQNSNRKDSLENNEKKTSVDVNEDQNKMRKHGSNDKVNDDCAIETKHSYISNSITEENMKTESIPSSTHFDSVEISELKVNNVQKNYSTNKEEINYQNKEHKNATFDENNDNVKYAKKDERKLQKIVPHKCKSFMKSDTKKRLEALREKRKNIRSRINTEKKSNQSDAVDENLLTTSNDVFRVEQSNLRNRLRVLREKHMNQVESNISSCNDSKSKTNRISGMAKSFSNNKGIKDILSVKENYGDMSYDCKETHLWKADTELGHESPSSKDPIQKQDYLQLGLGTKIEKGNKTKINQVHDLTKQSALYEHLKNESRQIRRKSHKDKLTTTSKPLRKHLLQNKMKSLNFLDEVFSSPNNGQLIQSSKHAKFESIFSPESKDENVQTPCQKMNKQTYSSSYQHGLEKTSMVRMEELNAEYELGSIIDDNDFLITPTK